MKYLFGFAFKMYKHFGEKGVGVNDFGVINYALKSIESESSQQLLIECIEKKILVLCSIIFFNFVYLYKIIRLICTPNSI